MIIKGNFLESKEYGQLHTVSGYMVLDDQGCVVSLTKERPADAKGELVDYGDCLILQGFCDMHLHAPQYPMRGLGMDLTLLDWLTQYTFPTEARFADLEYARTIYGQLARELIANGTTKVVMFSSLHTDGTLVLMEELEKAGISGYVGKVNMDRNGGENYQEETQESMEETQRWIQACEKFRLVKPIITPRFTPCCTDELMAWLGKTATEQQLPIQSHLSENDREIAWVQQLHPDCQQYWQTYEKYGLWNDQTVMAHCVYSNEQERHAMKQAGVLVAHCPSSNLNVSSGIAPITQMLSEGVKVALGSDISGGDQISMFKVMVCAIQSSKIRALYQGGDFLTALQAYYLATSAGQAYFGGETGFAIGQPLDAVVVDDSGFGEMANISMLRRLERAIYLGSPENIRAVYAGGKSRL